MSDATADRPWDRVRRLDAEAVVAAVAERTGVALSVDGPCPGGQVGASYVRWPDGHRSVLTWWPDCDLAEVRSGPLAVQDALRETGYPAPATELAVAVDGAVVTVQQLLPGTQLDHLDHRLLDQALDLNRRQAGVLAERRGIPVNRLYLRDDGPGFCLHRPVREYGGRGAALAAWVAQVSAICPEDRLDGVDAVHHDFHPGNMLAAGGSITGVVDWDGAARGDRRFDLVTLRFGLHVGQCPDGVIARVDELLDTMPREVLRPAWAHMSLRMADWSIRHFTAADTEHWLDLAWRRAD